MVCTCLFFLHFVKFSPNPNVQTMTHLLIIDPQNSFHPGGSLAIPTANGDAKRIADLIKANLNSITSVSVPLDSHHKNHIAHPGFWRNSDNASPAAFTLISNEDVKAKTWMPRNQLNEAWADKYTLELENQGRFKLCIWPEHCLMGSEGHNVVPVINDALNEWIAADETATRRCVIE